MFKVEETNDQIADFLNFADALIRGDEGCIVSERLYLTGVYMLERNRRCYRLLVLWLLAEVVR